MASNGKAVTGTAVMARSAYEEKKKTTPGDRIVAHVRRGTVPVMLFHLMNGMLKHFHAKIGSYLTHGGILVFQTQRSHWQNDVFPLAVPIGVLDVSSAPDLLSKWCATCKYHGTSCTEPTCSYKGARSPEFAPGAGRALKRGLL